MPKQICYDCFVGETFFGRTNGFLENAITLVNTGFGEHQWKEREK